jgi:hypothetical protein
MSLKKAVTQASAVVHMSAGFTNAGREQEMLNSEMLWRNLESLRYGVHESDIRT